jgi:hypothetical protein
MAARGSSNQVLSSKAHAILRSKLRANHPAVGGFGFQMRAFEWNGHRVFGHGGTWPGYESMLLILPDQEIALFFSITGPAAIGNLKAYDMVLTELLGPYRPSGRPMRLSHDQLRPFEGTYRPTLRNDSRVEGFLPYLGGGDGVSVKAASGGLIVGGEGPFLPVGDNVFWNPEAKQGKANPFGSKIFAFSRKGERMIMAQQQGLAPLERVSNIADPSIRAAALKWFGYLLLIGLGAFAWKKLAKRDWLFTAAAVLPPLCVIGLPFILTTGLGPGGLGGDLLEGRSGRFTALVSASWIVVGCAVVSAVAAYLWWTRERLLRPVWSRIHILIIALLQVAAASVLASVNLLGF